MPNSKIIRTAPEAQGDSAWNPPAGTLGQLVERAWERTALIKTENLPQADGGQGAAPSLLRALRGAHVGIIAEIKRSSPSRGPINPGMDSSQQAESYERGGAAAISVLTEPDRFGGSNADLQLARRAARLPVLKKDFHVSEAQLEEAARIGASAALVIVRAIAPSRLNELAAGARQLSLELLFEVRDESELDRALEAGAEMIGVNNRDLETLRMDRDTVSRIVPRIPAGCVAIAESGYSTREDVIEAAQWGADAVLMGSSLSAAPDPESAVRVLANIPRRARSG